LHSVSIHTLVPLSTTTILSLCVHTKAFTTNHLPQHDNNNKKNNMTEKEAEAKQLDSVTDRVAEQEVDLGKAQQAMSSLGGTATVATDQADQAVTSPTTVIQVSATDCQVLMDELEVSEDVAAKVLRQVAATAITTTGSSITDDHEAWVAAALRYLIKEAL
jgi:hypothetical protein